MSCLNFILILFCFAYKRFLGASLELLTPSAFPRVNEDFNLTCLLDKRVDVIRWYMNGMSIIFVVSENCSSYPQSNFQAFCNVEKINLQISAGNMTNGINGSKWQCVDPYGYSKSNVLKLFILDSESSIPTRNIFPILHEIEIKNDNGLIFSKQEMLELECIMSNSDTSDIIWTFTGEDMDLKSNSEITYRVLETSLTKPATVKNDTHMRGFFAIDTVECNSTGTYTCSCISNGSSFVLKNISIYIDCQPRILRTIPQIRQVIAYPGYSFNLSVLIEAYPAPNITWAFRDTNNNEDAVVNYTSAYFTVRTRKRIHQHSSVLEINNIRQKDLGTYIIKAVYQHGDTKAEFVIKGELNDTSTTKLLALVIAPLGSCLFVAMTILCLVNVIKVNRCQKPADPNQNHVKGQISPDVPRDRAEKLDEGVNDDDELYASADFSCESNINAKYIYDYSEVFHSSEKVHHGVNLSEPPRNVQITNETEFSSSKEIIDSILSSSVKQSAKHVGGNTSAEHRNLQCSFERRPVPAPRRTILGKTQSAL